MNKSHVIIKGKSYYKGDRLEMLKYVPSTSNKILEVGCGEGSFAKMLLASEKEVWGVEFNKDAAQIASELLYKVYNGAIEEVMSDIPNEYFDLIIFNDVLEHLVNPYIVLSCIYEKLNEKGKILASIPNIRFAKVIYNLLAKKDFSYTEMGILDNTHLRFFTYKTMQDLFLKNGYSIKFIEGINKSPSPLTHAFMLLLSILTFSNCRDILYTQFVILANKKLK